MLKVFSRFALLVVLVLASLTALPVVAKDGDVYPFGSDPFGRSYPQWSADWWRWALSVPPDFNPILDIDGSSCAVGQHGPVWFLAGAFGGTVVRNCAVPADRALFFPLINQEWENRWTTDVERSIEELRALVAGAGSPDNRLSLEVDGSPVLSDKNLHKYRCISDIFDYSFPVNNMAGQPAGVYYPTVADGYYIMLKPLSPGSHTVHFTASTPSGFSLDVTYKLTVIGLTGNCASPPCQQP